MKTAQRPPTRKPWASQTWQAVQAQNWMGGRLVRIKVPAGGGGKVRAAARARARLGGRAGPRFVHRGFPARRRHASLRSQSVRKEIRCQEDSMPFPLSLSPRLPEHQAFIKLSTPRPSRTQRGRRAAGVGVGGRGGLARRSSAAPHGPLPRAPHGRRVEMPQVPSCLVGSDFLLLSARRQKPG